MPSAHIPSHPGTKPLRWRPALGATGLALLLTSCAMVRSGEPARTPKLAMAPAGSCSARNLSAEQVFSTASKGVAVVSTGEGLGSAFVVAHQGGQTYLITNTHVVRGSDTVRLKWVDGSSDAAQVVARGSGDTPTSDLALLAVAGSRGTPLAMGDHPAAVGQEVFVIGAPKGLEFSLSRGVVSSVREKDRILQIDAAVNPGNSGGPVLDRGNCVAGVATFKLNDSEGLNFAISASVVRDFLANLPAAAAGEQAAAPRPPEAGANADGGETLCLFKRPESADPEQIPCRLSDAQTPDGQTIYQLAWADGSRNTYAFFGNGLVAIQADDGAGGNRTDQGSFRRTDAGVAVRSSSDAVAVIPGLDPVLN
ncbi:serine protease [Synechococcus sp. Tobar12-5m-g]|uniref:S1C family serine protease n=1 Tax=unclassified Synechococcus TaxID=2626047 RepID=UPI0020CE791C|nr:MULTISPECIES: S1C family serine protease [unclassified Synechococcus]MCP9773589.1 serine protease [Synechococcus sp. Tobar12-5m-g]MCP9874561.1 serine protease [Synechococcus sp. Cruz CV-v-12]